MGSAWIKVNPKTPGATRVIHCSTWNAYPKGPVYSILGKAGWASMPAIPRAKQERAQAGAPDETATAGPACVIKDIK
jgi:hypothetical protein